MAEVCSWLPQQILRQHSHRAEHQIRWLVDDLKVALVANMDEFEIDRLAYWADFDGEIEPDGYIPGGLPLLERGIMYDQPTRQVRLHAAPTVWDVDIFGAEGALIWKDTGNPERSPLVGVVDFDGPRVSVDDVFEIEWDPELGALAYEVVVPARFGGTVFA